MFRSGFSLIELMIVVALLGALVTIVIPSFSYTEQAAKGDLVAAEMRVIRESFIRYYKDNYPDGESLEAFCRYGLWPLFTTNSIPAEFAAAVRGGGYDAANGLGWRGPYVFMEKGKQSVYPRNGQPRTGSAEGGSGISVEIPVALDPYGGYYRVMMPDGAVGRLYLVFTGPDGILETDPTAIDSYGQPVAGKDDSVLPLFTP